MGALLGGGTRISGLAGPAQGLASSEPDGSGPVEELEAFSMRESQRFRQGGLDPSSRPVSSVFSGTERDGHPSIGTVCYIRAHEASGD